MVTAMSTCPPRVILDPQLQRVPRVNIAAVPPEPAGMHARSCPALTPQGSNPDSRQEASPAGPDWLQHCHIGSILLDPQLQHMTQIVQRPHWLAGVREERPLGETPQGEEMRLWLIK